MSKYTTELRFICETSAGLTDSEGYNSINSILNKCVDKIFDFDFPIFDETYRRVLERKILKHYYTREIATETVGLWKHFLDTRLNEIMPYYNKLYESELLDFNPFYSVDLRTESQKVGNKNANETGKSENLTHNITDTNKNEKVNSTETEEYNSSSNKSDSGTITDTGTTNQTKTNNTTQTERESGTITDSGTATNTRTDNTTQTATNSGSDTVSGSVINKNSRWDIYSDTPQGSLQNITLNDGAYLTNARHIIDDGTGSTNSSTTQYGKVTTTKNTGTTQDNGTSENERELNTTKTTQNTGDVTDSGVNTNTRTLGTTETSENEGENNRTNSTTANGNTNTTNTGTSDTNTSREEDINTTEDYLQHVWGKTPGISFSKLLTEYRETFLNIDMLIIRELSDLFFGLW